jgi:hypothetical protein
MSAVAIGSAVPDPVCAAISNYVELEEQASKALEVYAKAEELFRDEFGSSPRPDGFYSDWWDAWDERVNPFYTVFDDACNLWSDAAVGVLTAMPTSLGGIQALLSLVRQRQMLFELCHPDLLPQFLETLTIALTQGPTVPRSSIEPSAKTQRSALEHAQSNGGAEAA